MRNCTGDGKQHQQQKNGRGGAGNKLYGLLRIVSSGASTVARSAANVVAQSLADRSDGAGGDAGHDQVLWAGFDKLERENNVLRQVLLLGYRSGFQVWDVEEADNVCALVSRHDGPASFLQMLPKPIPANNRGDKFSESRPMLVVCADWAFSGTNTHDGLDVSSNGNSSINQESGSGISLPTVVRFYSLTSQSYMHMLKFRSVVYSVRCSSRIVAISQAAQIHCFDAATLERDYTILTNPIVMGAPGSGGVGYGPLAVGPRWLAYSGSPVLASNPSRVTPKHLTTSASFSGSPSNGSLVKHYAKESSKQLAAGIVTLGDVGYKKLTRYCSELLPESHSPASLGWKANGAANGHSPDLDNVGMVVVRDIVNKLVVAQFRAHKSPISALCFDPSGTLLVTTSIQGHNINVFKIFPRRSSSGDAGASYAHVYRLQRGLTNAVIQDISFSDDSHWIMISSSRGTSHLFAINPLGGTSNFQSRDVSSAAKVGGPEGLNKPAGRLLPNGGLQVHNAQNSCSSGSPVTLSVVSRIRNGSNGWRGAAAAAAGRFISISGAFASSFHNCKGAFEPYMDGMSLRSNYHLLVFSSSGSMVQYSLRLQPGIDSTAFGSGLSTAFESESETDGRLAIEAIQKWNICQKQNRRDWEDNTDIYGANGPVESNKIYPEGIGRLNGVLTEDRVSVMKQKIGPEEKHHLYISEAELQMHGASNPLWAKPEIYFQCMVPECINVDGESLMQAEFEIERIPTRTVEARSKDLIPVFDYLQAPKFQLSSYPTANGHVNGRYQHQRSSISDSGTFSRRASSASLDSMSDGVPPAELRNGVKEFGWSSPSSMLKETRGIVNSFDVPKSNTRNEIVYNRKNENTKGRLEFVNTNNEESKMENHFEDEGDEFD